MLTTSPAPAPVREVVANMATKFNESLARKELYRLRLEYVVQAIEDAALWCGSEESERGLMMLLVDAKNLAAAA